MFSEPRWFTTWLPFVAQARTPARKYSVNPLPAACLAADRLAGVHIVNYAAMPAIAIAIAIGIGIGIGIEKMVLVSYL